MKIYRECTKEPYNFLTIDTTLPASDPLRFKIVGIFIKMTLTDELKILDDLTTKLKQIKLGMI